MKTYLSVLLVALSAGCARDLPGEAPPSKTFYYPTSVAVSPDHRYAYVVNSNFDLRFNAGWVSVVDLDAVLAQVDAGNANGTEPITAQLKVLPLAGRIALSPEGSLAVLPHRGEPTLSLIEVDEGGAALSCGDPHATENLNELQELTDCDSEHLVALEAEMFDQEVDDYEIADPFASTIVSAGGETLVAIGHLSAGDLGGRISVFALHADPPALTPRRAVRIDLSGVGLITVHPDESHTYLAATSQTYSLNTALSTVYSVDIVRVLTDCQTKHGDDSTACGLDASCTWSDVQQQCILVDGGEGYRVTYHPLSGYTGGIELLGMSFSPDGQWAYAANRSPDGVVVLDASLHTVEVEEGGERQWLTLPHYTVVGATPIPERPAGVLYVPRSQGPDIIAVTSFDDDALFVLAPQGSNAPLVTRLDDIGLGPFDVVYASRGGRDLLLVPTFFDHGLVVVDITAAEPNHFTVIAHMRSDKTKPAEDAR